MSCECQSQYDSTIHNPCRVSETNTAACESTPSVIDNFITHFFGSVTKTEVDGRVQWVLPCNLDTGLPENPRQPGEGLACYFLRLFEEGIIGLEGPQGPPGKDGANGLPGFTITLTSYTQPSLSSPYFSVRLAPHPAFTVGATVFIEGTGWARIESIGAENVYFLTLLELIPGAASGTITAGKRVSISGPQGAKGEKGDKGDTGPEGPPGETFTADSSTARGYGSSHFNLPTTWTPVTFSESDPILTLANPGTYLLIGKALIYKIGSGGADENWELRFRDTTSNVDITESHIEGSGWVTGQKCPVTLYAVYTAVVPNTTIMLYGKCNYAATYAVVRWDCVVNYIRLS